METRTWRNTKVNETLHFACWHSSIVGNEFPDFDDVIWEEDIESIISDCKLLGIKSFTISGGLCGGFQRVIRVIARFMELGCELDGMVKVKACFATCELEEPKWIPALKMTIKGE